MTKLTEQIKRSGEILDSEFPDIFHLPEGGMTVWLEGSYTNEIKSHLTSSQIELLKVLKGEVDRWKKKYPETCPKEDAGNLDEWERCELCDRERGFNFALSQVIELLDNAIKENI